MWFGQTRSYPQLGLNNQMIIYQDYVHYLSIQLNKTLLNLSFLIKFKVVKTYIIFIIEEKLFLSFFLILIPKFSDEGSTLRNDLMVSLLSGLSKDSMIRVKLKIGLRLQKNIGAFHVNLCPNFHLPKRESSHFPLFVVTKILSSFSISLHQT